MQQILKFFVHNKVGILFLVLFVISIGLTFQAHSYHNSKWVSSTNSISSFFFDLRYDFTSYLNLKKENHELQQQNAFLLELVNDRYSQVSDSSFIKNAFRFKNANVISNSYAKNDNYILLNVGSNQGIIEGSAVSIPNGILGIVEKTNSRYSRVISILNSNLSINAKVKNSNQFGSLKWYGKDYNTMTLEDIPRSAVFKKGDTIVTGGNSLIFPKNLPIGIISDFQLDENAGYFTINVKLFADMSNLNQAYVIVPNTITEAKSLLE